MTFPRTVCQHTTVTQALSDEERVVIQRARDRLVVCRTGFPKSAASPEALIREMTAAFVIIDRLIDNSGSRQAMTIEQAYAVWRDKGANSLADLIAAAEELPDHARADVIGRIGEWVILHSDVIAALEEIASEQKIYKGHGDYDIAPKLNADEAMMRARAALMGLKP